VQFKYGYDPPSMALGHGFQLAALVFGGLLRRADAQVHRNSFLLAHVDPPFGPQARYGGRVRKSPVLLFD
jgi:hypothetical protein